jgi:glycosyltransferase involved in cell wall biosynthesis
MKIAFISGRDPTRQTDTDGATVLVYALSNQLARLGCSVSIYVPDYEHVVPNPQHKYGSEAITAINDSVRVIRFPVQTATAEPDEYFALRSQRSDREAAYFANEQLYEYDLVCIFHVTHAFALVEQAKLPIERTVLFPMFLGSYYAKTREVPNEYVARERSTLQALSHISSPSRDEIGALINEYGVSQNVCFYTPRGFDTTVFPAQSRTRIAGDSIHIINPNNIKPQKQQRELVPLVAQLHAFGIPVHVHLLGALGTTTDRSYRSYGDALLDDIATHQLGEAFTFHGIVTQMQLQYYIEQADIAVFPSKTETFGKAALEMMASGLPTVVFDDVPAFAEFIEHGMTGLRVSRDTRTLAHAIAALYRSPELYKRLSIEGMTASRRYSWEAVTEQLCKQLRERNAVTIAYRSD